MSLEQTIRDQIISEAADLGGRLDQLVRAGLMPSNILPVLHRAIAKVQNGMTLQGSERDAMNMFINSMMFIVLGDDTVFHKARAGAKGYAAEEVDMGQAERGMRSSSRHTGGYHVVDKAGKVVSKHDNQRDAMQAALKNDDHRVKAIKESEEVEEAVGDYTVKTVSPADAWKKHTGQKTSKSKVPVDPKTGKTLYQKVTSEETEELDENAKIVAHLQKRYGDNIRKSHVRSAANDFGVGYVALSHAVRKKLGKKMLDEENHYTVHKAAKGWHVNQHTDNGVWHHATQTGYHDSKEKAVAWAKKHAGTRPHKIEIKEEQIDEISKKTLASYSDKAVRQTYGNQPHGKDALRKRTNREQGVKAAYNKFFGYKTKVPATEEVEIQERDEGKPGKMFAKIAAKAAKKYGSKEAGNRVAGAIRKKVLAKESIDLAKKLNESYQTAFDAALEQYNVKSPSELDEEKRKEFFNFVDQEYKKGDN